jgi:16S rRNA (guanine527-N7)-methyltransferase
VKQDPLEAFQQLIATAPLRLVGSAEPAQLAAHVEDALGALPLLATETGPLVDVGSGAGLPGVPILLARDDLAGTLLDSRAGRCAHLRRVVEATGLADRVRVVHARAEELAERDAFGIAVARALAPPPVALELCLPLVRTGGICLLHAGAVDPAALERVASALAACVERIEPVPGFAARTRVLVRKTGPTPAGFPRRVGAASRDPIVRPEG